MRIKTTQGAQTAADRGLIRWYIWYDEHLGLYPANVLDEDEWRVAVRFCHALDNAALLLSDQRLNRLMRLLKRLDATGSFFPATATSGLLALPEDDFSFLVSRRIASVVANPGVGAEAMASNWRRSFRFEAEPGEPSGTLYRDGFVSHKKPFRGLLIDRDLDVAQMERLNSMPGIRAGGTCAGHPEHPQLGSRKPRFGFTVSGRRRVAEKAAVRLAQVLRNGDTEATVYGATVHVESRIVSTGTNQAVLYAWWDAAISRLASTLDVSQSATHGEVQSPADCAAPAVEDRNGFEDAICRTPLDSRAPEATADAREQEPPKGEQHDGR